MKHGLQQCDPLSAGQTGKRALAQTAAGWPYVMRWGLNAWRWTKRQTRQTSGACSIARSEERTNRAPVFSRLLKGNRCVVLEVLSGARA
jgi:putative SOS response-associated peptidase YedK